jgi:hypothetical protein
MKILLIVVLLVIGCVQPDINQSATGPNANPVITDLTAIPSTSTVGEIVTVTSVASDPDGDPLSYEWYMTAGDLLGDGPVVRYIATYCCVGVNTVRVTVKDGRGGSATRFIDVQVRNP